MRLIDADYADQLAKDLFKGQIGITFYQAVHAMLESLPTIDAFSVVHAHWEQKDCSKWPVCSNCGKPTLSRGYCPVRSNYCPSCDALMDGKDDDS